MYRIFISLFLVACGLQADSPRLHLCTTASHWKPEVEQLINSCDANGLAIEVFGLGEPFTLDNKLRHCMAFIENLPDDDVAMFVDAYDVLLLAGEEKILDAFLSMNEPIVFSGEAKCHPYKQVAAKYPESPTKFRYLNSGSYIGYVKDLKRVFAAMLPIPPGSDDQALFTLYMLYHPGEIAIDYYCKLFLTLHRVADQQVKFDLNRRNLRFRTTGTYPCLAHGNGKEGQKLYQHIYTTLFASEYGELIK